MANEKDMALPNPQHEAVAKLCEEIRRGRFEPFLPSFLQKRQWYSAFIMECNKLPKDTQFASMMKAAVNVATLGLIPGETLGHCYLQAYNMHKGRADEHRICQVIPGYRGYLELAFRNKFLSQVSTELVLQSEEFRHWHNAEGPQIQHEIPLDRQEASRGTVRAVYATYHTTSGGRGLEVVHRNEIDKIDTNRNVWKTNFAAMCRKTAVRRAAKYWMITAEMSLAIQLDEQDERGEEQTCDNYQEDPGLNMEGNARRVLDAKLSEIGCSTSMEREWVLSWALGGQFNYTEVAENEDLIRSFGQKLRQFVAGGKRPSDMLEVAMKEYQKT